MANEFHWPNGKRIAVTVTVMLETWSEGKAPPYSVQASPLKAGTVDLAGIAWGSYGGKVGVYRLINLLKEHGIKGTFCVNGRCAEIFPEAVAQIVKSGHDVAGHAYLQDQVQSAMSAEEEQAMIKNSSAFWRKSPGMRPAGWISPSMAFTPHTRDFLAAEKMLWHGDAREIPICLAWCRPNTADRAHSRQRLHRQSGAALKLTRSVGCL